MLVFIDKKSNCASPICSWIRRPCMSMATTSPCLLDMFRRDALLMSWPIYVVHALNENNNYTLCLQVNYMCVNVHGCVNATFSIYLSLLSDLHGIYQDVLGFVSCPHCLWNNCICVFMKVFFWFNVLKCDLIFACCSALTRTIRTCVVVCGIHILPLFKGACFM